MEIRVPPLSESVSTATLIKWRKQEGEAVQKGEPLFELETDKSVVTVESFYSGTLLKILVPEGETVPVGTTIAWIGEPGEELPEA